MLAMIEIKHAFVLSYTSYEQFPQGRLRFFLWTGFGTKIAPLQCLKWIIAVES
jgi:hypothetical protein